MALLMGCCRTLRLAMVVVGVLLVEEEVGGVMPLDMPALPLPAKRGESRPRLESCSWGAVEGAPTAGARDELVGGERGVVFCEEEPKLLLLMPRRVFRLDGFLRGGEVRAISGAGAASVSLGSAGYVGGGTLLRKSMRDSSVRLGLAGVARSSSSLSSSMA
jgi:hypothetical protein